jgi:ABC-type branched-subunit amino acid transport system substrate-binding protein
VRPVLCLLILALLLLPLAAAALSPEEIRGRQIYTLGTSASGIEIKAVLGEEGNELPASALPCAGCHGREGHGGKEGGVRPSDLTREALGRPAVGERGGRRHPPYDDHLLIRAITLGVDPAGNRLHVAMPRYRLTQKDAADLLAYLKRLGHEEEPGLTPGAVHVGVLLSGGARAEETAEVRAALTARGAEIDNSGGIYGRRLALDFITLPEPPAERAAKLRERLAGEPLFALIGTDLSGAEGEMADVAEAAGVPLLSTLAARPRESSPPDRHVFYLTSGLAEQAEALIAAAAQRLPPGERSLAIVPPASAALAGIAAAAAETARRSGFRLAEATEAPGAILLLDRGAAARERLAREQGRRPLVLLPGVLPGEDLFTLVPAPLGDRLLISLPVLPARSAPAQTAALAAAEVLIEGLRRAGREVSRESLTATLETLYRFDAGLGAPVTFGPNRRLGARGAFVTGIDFPRRALAGAASWIELAD